MRRKQIISGIVALCVLSGCSVFPIKPSVEAGHSRLENFTLDDGKGLEHVRLMCFRNKLNDRSSARQLPAGKHNLLVSVFIAKNHASFRTKEGFAQISVELQEGAEYTLNRKIQDDTIALWIQDLDSNQRVSEIVTTDLQHSIYKTDAWRRAQCKSSTV